jgi:hypothetical protein
MIKKIQVCRGLGGLHAGIAFILFFTISALSFSQEPPPRPIVVTATSQGISFGSFSQGPAGGTVAVTAVGARSSTGDIVLLSFNPAHSAALFEVVGNPGTLVSLLSGSTALLTGSNGGSMLLTVGGTNPASPFIITAIPPAATLLYVGGTLTVGAPGSNPPGSFSGTFNITLIQE